MSDHNLLDDPLVSFDQQSNQQQLSPTKAKTNDPFENRLLDDIDPFGNHNGHNSTNDNNTNKDTKADPFSMTNELFPADPNEIKTSKKQFIRN